MSTEAHRKENVRSLPVASNLLTCPHCDQEMYSSDSRLPLHMTHARLCRGSYSLGAPPKFGKQIKEPLTIADISELSVSEILAADMCMSCGGAKAPGQTLCSTCYGLLPFLHQKCLPPFIRGYLFEQKKIAGAYNKAQFFAVLKAALEALAELRSVEQPG